MAYSQLTITLLNSLGTVVVPLSSAQQSSDSSYNQNASAQTGFSAVDQQVRNIFRAGCFFVPASGVWYSSALIQSIAFS